MELKYLRLIKTIAEEGNLVKATHRLFLTQSALSHQLRDLEERMGFKVFLRTRHQWRLTEEGQELYNLANKVLEEITLGLEKIHQIQEGSVGKIRISTECYSFYQSLPRFIQKMAVLYPEIEIDLVIEDTHQPIQKILTNELDIALVTHKPTHESLITIEIFQDEIFALMHQEYPLNHKPYLEAGDFEQIHLLIHSFPLETVSIYQRYLKPHQITPLKISAIPLTEVSLEMVKANMGVMCVPQWALQPFHLPKELIFKKIGKNGLKRTHYLVLKQSDRDKKYLKDFIGNIEEEFEGVSI
ncbi:LysR family transcriptional regulator [marine bacterium AO1-C]|nr:LysR family transcriptional regulator [marine bacterium AO1-C]